MSYYESGEKTRAYHHTAPVSMLYALRQALRVIEEAISVAKGGETYYRDQLEKFTAAKVERDHSEVQ